MTLLPPGCRSLTPRCLRGFREDVALARLNISGCYKLGDDFLRPLLAMRPNVLLYNNPNENAPWYDGLYRLAQ